MSDKTLEHLPNTPVKPDLILGQLLEQVDSIDSLIVGIHTKNDGFTVLHSSSKLKDLSMIGRLVENYVNELIKEYLKNNPK